MQSQADSFNKRATKRLAPTSLGLSAGRPPLHAEASALAAALRACVASAPSLTYPYLACPFPEERRVTTWGNNEASSRPPWDQEHQVAREGYWLTRAGTRHLVATCSRFSSTAWRDTCNHWHLDRTWPSVRLRHRPTCGTDGLPNGAEGMSLTLWLGPWAEAIPGPSGEMSTSPVTDLQGQQLQCATPLQMAHEQAQCVAFVCPLTRDASELEDLSKAHPGR